MMERKAPMADYWGTCSNCGARFYRPGTHGQNCGCGHPLSAHEVECWGNHGDTPHPRNPAYVSPEVRDERHKRKVETARNAMLHRLGRDSGGSTPNPVDSYLAAENGGVA